MVILIYVSVNRKKQVDINPMTNYIHNSLDLPREEFEALLFKTVEMILKKSDTMEDEKAFSGLTPEDIRKWMDKKLPNDGMGF